MLLKAYYSKEIRELLGDSKRPVSTLMLWRLLGKLISGVRLMNSHKKFLGYWDISNNQAPIH